MMNEIEESAFVLVVCTETYDRRFRGKEDLDKGFGATWEGFIITNEIYRNASRNTKFIPVVFSTADAKHIPSILRDATFYRLDTEEGYEDLYRRLTAQPGIVKPPVGARRALPPRNLQSRAPSESLSDGDDEKPVAKLPSESEKLPLPEPLVYLHLLNSNSGFIPALRIEHEGKTLKLLLKPTNSKDSAFLSGLRRNLRNNIAVAYRDEALLASINSASQIMEPTGEVWSVLLELPDNHYHYGGMMESSINGVTPDEIAELRARRLLLDEKLSPRDFGRDNFIFELIEDYMSRANGVVSFAESPLPQFFQSTKLGTALFLAAARLMLVMALKLSGTVEHIFRLELHMQSDSEVAISFQGQRPQRYQNAEPVMIEVEGVCRLA